MIELNASIAHIPLPPRMISQPISPKGFPVPWFVAWIDGVPDFRVIDTPKVERAVRQQLCWLCGQKLGRHLAFVIGPMCAVNRVSSEPPSHHDCAAYAVKACPFLTQPRMRRNEKDLPTDGKEPPGMMILRNPGVTLLWMTRSYKLFNVGGGQPGRNYLFKVGDPDTVTFFCQGRIATRAEILDSIDSGMPILRAAAERDGFEAIKALARQHEEALRLLPAA
jgi:hypothetical protein